MMTLITNILKFCLNVIYAFFKCFKTRKQITLISRESNEITIDFKLLEDAFKKELPEYKVVVLCKMMDNKFTYFFHMFKQMYHISRSKIIILDTYCFLASNLNHKKNLKIIQIWHAIGAMKKAGYAILDKEEGRSKKMSTLANMHKNYTNVFTSSEACNEMMSKVFNCDVKICKSVPLPRIDMLKNKKNVNNVSKEIYKKYPILKEKTNVIYAPTFRKNEELMKEKIIELYNHFDFDKYNLIVKLHPLSKININNENVIYANEFTTTQMLFVSDFVISDYSSIIYEAGILEKKLLFYAFDYDDYKDKRDFFIDYEKEIPGPLCRTYKDINNFLENPNNAKYKNRNMISKYVDLSINNYTNNMVGEIIKLL